MRYYINLIESAQAEAELLHEGPIAKAVATALLSLGLMASPSASADHGHDDFDDYSDEITQNVDAAFSSKHGKFILRGKPAESEHIYKKTIFSVASNVLQSIDKEFTPKYINSGVLKSLPAGSEVDHSKRIFIMDNGDGSGIARLSLGSATSQTQGNAQGVADQNRMIEMRYKNFAAESFSYVANPEQHRPDAGAPDSNDYSKSNQFQEFDITKDVLAKFGGKLNWKEMALKGADGPQKPQYNVSGQIGKYRN